MRFAAWFLVVAWFGQAAVAGQPGPVGTERDARSLTIEGTAAFAPQQIKDALLLNSAFQLAADASTPLDDYLKTLQRLIRTGYRDAGFPNVEVSASVDAKTGTVVVHVTEGPRYLAGDIRISGGKTIPVAQLVERLSKPHPPKDAVAQLETANNGATALRWVDLDGADAELQGPVWRPGKPAPFLAMGESDSELHRAVADALADFGYFFAQFTVDVVADAASRKGHLAIHVSGEGVRSAFADAEIHGNQANARGDILKYLAFQPGGPATREELARLQARLWHSGRFIKSSVTLLRPAKPTDPAKVRIDLVELQGATPLSKPLSREEELLLKCRDRTANPDCGDGDFVFDLRGKEGSGTIVVSPRGGMFLGLEYSGTPGQNRAEYRTILSSEEIGLYCISGGRKFTARPPGGQLIGSLGLRLNENANEANEGRSMLAFSFGCKSDHSHSALPVKLTMGLDPAFFVDLAHRPLTKVTVQDGRMILSSHKETIRLDATTGKLLEYVVTAAAEAEAQDDRPSGKKTSPSPSTGESHGTMRIAFSPGEFRRRLEAAHAATSQATNAWDGSRPVSSLLSFFSDEDRLWQWIPGADGRRAQQIVRRMLNQNVAEPLDLVALKLLGAGKSSATDEAPDFVIREASGSSRKTDQDSLQWVAFSWAMAREFVRPGSWPEVATQAAWRMAAGGDESALRDWKKLYESHQSGPLCFLACGALLKGLNSPMAQLMAARGLGRLSIDDFRKEYSTLLDPKYRVGQFAHRVAAFLRELDDRDLDCVAGLFPGGFARRFQKWGRGLKQNRQRSPDEALPELLDGLWQDGLREWVSCGLTILQYLSATAAHGGDPGKALADTDLAIRLDPRDAGTHRIRAWAYASQNDYDKTIAETTAALQLEPNDAWGHYARGSAYATKRDLASAIRDYTDAIRLAPDHRHTYLCARAWAYQQNADYDKAIADYSEAIRLNPGFAEAYLGRSHAYLASKNDSQAAADKAAAQRLQNRQN